MAILINKREAILLARLLAKQNPLYCQPLTTKERERLVDKLTGLSETSEDK